MNTTLYIFTDALGLRNASPFCLKVEMALKHLGIDHEIKIEDDPRKAPKGKLPYLLIDGQTIADSEIIFEFLDQKTNGGLYGDLSTQEKAQGTAFTRLAEDHLYWLMVASRWLDDDYWPHTREGFFGDLPGPIRAIVTRIARRQVRQTYNLHGLGKHSLDEQKQFALQDLQAISDVVSENQYITGARLTAFDFSVASMVSGILDNKPHTWLTKVASATPALADYAERVQTELGVFGRMEVVSANDTVDDNAAAAAG